MKAWACVNSRGKLFCTFLSNHPSCEGRYGIYKSYREALENSLGPYFIREVTITIHKRKAVRSNEKGGSK